MRGTAVRRSSGAGGDDAVIFRQPALKAMPDERWGPGACRMAAVRRQHPQSPLQFRQQQSPACRVDRRLSHWTPGAEMTREAASSDGSHALRIGIAQPI